MSGVGGAASAPKYSECPFKSGHRPLYRLQTLRRSFWDDRAWVPLKMILLAALFLLAALL